MPTTIRVNLKKTSDRSYDILIESGLVQKIALDLKERRIADRYFVVTDTNVAEIAAQNFIKSLRLAEIPVDFFVAPAGEQSKQWPVVSQIIDVMSSLRLDRKSGVIAFGGGVVGDMAGFAAAIYMRGIPYVQIPTTLLAQVDSSIGGKTGIDTNYGKNLIGAFYQPACVYIDPEMLRTLPEREIKNGLAEVVKYAIIRDPELFKILEERKENVIRLDSRLIQDIIARCCAIKADVVERDEKEGGLRRILNFGHTIGHGVEAAYNFSIPHGFAVSIGMAAVTRLSVAEGILSQAVGQRILSLLSRYGLPIEAPSDAKWKEIVSYMKSDKKSVSGRPVFVLVKEIGEVLVYDKLLADRVEHILTSD